MGAWGRCCGGLDLQYDKPSHSTLKPSLRPSSEINKFGRAALDSQAIAECCFFSSYMREKGGRCLFVSMETILGRTVCLGKGCERRASPSNQLEPYAEAAGLGLG